MSGDMLKIWCPNCHRDLYVHRLSSGEFHKVKCDHCGVPFLYDRYGQTKREANATS